ncbi:MAG: hypothetical protein D6808_06510 [Candidatus Dadabacteria bacterium]|nr:MAG: hypothetical protein D6808_06510 [Candidatus Dadabacteria bacterium]
MYRFVVLASYTDHITVDRMCERLERNGIPVMLDHVEISKSPHVASVIRLMVPTQYVQRASALLRSGRDIHSGGNGQMAANN